MAAENVRARSAPPGWPPHGVNEAAAHGRGKHPGFTGGGGDDAADVCFNEAAAHGRGKRAGRERSHPRSGRLQ